MKLWSALSTAIAEVLNFPVRQNTMIHFQLFWVHSHIVLLGCYRSS